MIFIESGGNLDGHRQASEDANEIKKNGKIGFQNVFISRTLIHWGRGTIKSNVMFSMINA